MNAMADDRAVARPAAGSRDPSTPARAAGASAAPVVLSTLNADGTRRWLRPRVSRGRFLTARRLVAYALIVLFALIPQVQINGKPAMLLDVARRQFTFFGATFVPTDTVLLALFLLSVFVAVFLFTAVVGRVWCGWACPQTVYLEFLYRPLERLLDGTRGRGGRPAGARPVWRTVLLYAAYLVISLFLAHTFLAYFVGAEELARWVRRSPLEHPASFGVMVVTTGLMLFNFCYFREQTCVLACPYGRFQSVMLDRDSLIISYDERRGEPRGRRLRSETQSGPRRGDCVDCGLCVVTCPTGIDIRKGLQMECVGCAQCIDACDAVMDKIGRPRGLIRYTSEARLRGERGRLVRGRVVVYSVILLLAAGGFTTLLLTRPAADVEILRGVGLPYSVLPDGRVANPVRIKITNRSPRAAEYAIGVERVAGAELRLEPNPIRLEPGQSQTVAALVVRPPDAAADGPTACGIRVRDGAAYDKTFRYILLGPARSETEQRRER